MLHAEVFEHRDTGRRRDPARLGAHQRLVDAPVAVDESLVHEHARHGGDEPRISVTLGSITIIARPGSAAIALSVVRAWGMPWEIHGFLAEPDAGRLSVADPCTPPRWLPCPRP